MNDRQKLMKQIASLDFAIIELHIFLNTHPDDMTAAQKMDEYIEKSNKLRAEYEEKYGPIQSTDISSNQWAWISNPWPWDNEEGE